MSRLVALVALLLAAAPAWAQSSRRYPPEPPDRDREQAQHSKLWESAANPQRTPYGKLVFEAENAVQVLLKHVTESPVPPSVRGGLPVPPELDEVVLACLAKEPADRPQSALELSRRLGEIRGIKWGPDQAAEWWRAAAPT